MTKSAPPARKPVKAAPKPKHEPAPIPETVPADFLSMLDNMKVAELKAVIARAEKLLEDKVGSEQKGFIEETLARAAGLGMDLKAYFTRSPAKRGRPAGLTGGTRASPAPKYKSPDGQTWSGRGREPRWLSAQIAEGKKKEDFLIEKA